MSPARPQRGQIVATYISTATPADAISERSADGRPGGGEVVLKGVGAVAVMEGAGDAAIMEGAGDVAVMKGARDVATWEGAGGTAALGDARGGAEPATRTVLFLRLIPPRGADGRGGPPLDETRCIVAS